MRLDGTWGKDKTWYTSKAALTRFFAALAAAEVAKQVRQGPTVIQRER
ncbi:MAG TPA: hypothetical protein VM597_17865 [Gemmataceae bacterium]|nr:hypothetical protein [Gemmataceae bacterium]